LFEGDPDITIIQGDIIVPNFHKINNNSSEKFKDNNKNARKKRRIITNNQFGTPTRWPNKTIPYEYDTDASMLKV
jgi:hypothetical protein